jgi:hypothetical protein
MADTLRRRNSIPRHECLNLHIIRFTQHHLCTLGSNDSNPIVGDSIRMLLAAERMLPSIHVNELQIIILKTLQ